MPRPGDCKHAVLLRWLQDEYDRLNEAHHKLLPPHGTIPAGGEHMDPFFRMEAIRGCQKALREGKTEQEAIEAGAAEAGIAVRIWNARREYQVHRWDGFGEGYLQDLLRHFHTLKNIEHKAVLAEIKSRQVKISRKE